MLDDKTKRMVKDFRERELRVLEKTMAEPMMEHLKKRGLTQKEIDGVFAGELRRQLKDGG